MRRKLDRKKRRLCVLYAAEARNGHSELRAINIRDLGMLNCRDAELSKYMFQVTWIRQGHADGRKDRQLLTVGRGTHSIDTRFVVVNSPDWSLMIKNVKHEDAGLYECQVTQALRTIMSTSESMLQGSDVRPAEAPRCITGGRARILYAYISD